MLTSSTEALPDIASLIFFSTLLSKSSSFCNSAIEDWSTNEALELESTALFILVIADTTFLDSSTTADMDFFKPSMFLAILPPSEADMV